MSQVSIQKEVLRALVLALLVIGFPKSVTSERRRVGYVRKV